MLPSSFIIRILILILIQIVLHPDRGGTTPSGVPGVSPYASRGIPRGSRSEDGVCGRGDGGIVGIGWAETVSGIILGRVNLSSASQHEE